jgi:hypothetical protein
MVEIELDVLNGYCLIKLISKMGKIGKCVIHGNQPEKKTIK